MELYVDAMNTDIALQRAFLGDQGMIVRSLGERSPGEYIRAEHGPREDSAEPTLLGYMSCQILDPPAFFPPNRQKISTFLNMSAPPTVVDVDHVNGQGNHVPFLRELHGTRCTVIVRFGHGRVKYTNILGSEERAKFAFTPNTRMDQEGTTGCSAQRGDRRKRTRRKGRATKSIASLLNVT